MSPLVSLGLGVILPSFRFVFDPATGTTEIAPEYRIVVIRALNREARRMKRALYLSLFLLNLEKLAIEARYMSLSVYRNVVRKLN